MIGNITKRLVQNFAQKITNREALNKALDEELARNPKVFIMGE